MVYLQNEEQTIQNSSLHARYIVDRFQNEARSSKQQYFRNMQQPLEECFPKVRTSEDSVQEPLKEEEGRWKTLY